MENLFSFPKRIHETVGDWEVSSSPDDVLSLLIYEKNGEYLEI